jgi:hypothetical protein
VAARSIRKVAIASLAASGPPGIVGNRLTAGEKDFASRMPLSGAFRAFATEGADMRAHYVIAVIAVILVGIGVKLPFFTAPIAEADSRSIESLSADISQMHHSIRNSQAQKFHDMSLVFPVLPDGD